MSKLIGFATLAGATCLMIGSALAQGQTPPAQTPAEKDVRSDSSPVRPIPPIRPRPCLRCRAEGRAAGTKMCRHLARTRTSRPLGGTRMSRLHETIRTCKLPEPLETGTHETTRMPSLLAWTRWAMATTFDRRRRP
jgi:hypothetical protein